MARGSDAGVLGGANRRRIHARPVPGRGVGFRIGAEGQNTESGLRFWRESSTHPGRAIPGRPDQVVLPQACTLRPGTRANSRTFAVIMVSPEIRQAAASQFPSSNVAFKIEPAALCFDQDTGVDSEPHGSGVPLWASCSHASDRSSAKSAASASERWRRDAMKAGSSSRRIATGTGRSSAMALSPRMSTKDSPGVQLGRGNS